MQATLNFILSIVVTLTSLFGLLGEKYEVFKDIRYGEAERDLVNIYVPENAYDRDYNGCILYIHGGSWQGGEKEHMSSHCKRMAMKGYVTATMSYSLCNDDNFGEVTAYTMVDEVGMCIQAIKDFSDEHELNITTVATSVYSAGGHISMLYAYAHADECPLELAFTANRVGPSDLSKEVWGSYGLASRLTGVRITDEMIENGEAARLAADISPVTYVTKDSVPSLFCYAGLDPLVIAGNRESLLKVMRESGAVYTYVFYPLSAHGLLLDPWSEVIYYQHLYDYCETYFGY